MPIASKFSTRLLGVLLATLSLPALAQRVVSPSMVAVVNAPYGTTPSYIRLGAPIAFSARMLPADATGTINFSIDGGPPQTIALAQQTLGDYIALGDSITYDGYIGDPSMRYAYAVGQSLNLTTFNYAAPGYTACDVMPKEILPNNVGTAPATSPLYSLLIGTNDLNLFGTGGHEELFNLCHQAILTWLGVPRASKQLIGDAGVAITSGTWTAALAPAGCCLNALTNTSGSGTVRFTLTTNGGPAYLWYPMQTATAGSFTVSVDGGASSSPVQTQFTSTAETIPVTYGVLRLPVAAGVHTFDVAALSGTVGVLGIGSPAAGGSLTVLVGDVPNQLNGNASGVAEYTADIQANISQLRADGLDLRFVPTQKYMLATPAEMMNTLHPNAVGLAEIAQAFEAAITPAAPAADTLTAATAGFSTSTLPIGSHGISMHYSGDQNYAAADAGVGVVIYDATSSVTLAAPAVATALTPITLTANVPQTNASGAVNFVEVTSTGNIALGSAWISGNAATLTLPSLFAGKHKLLAQYLGDANYSNASSAPITVDVAGVYTSTTLSAPATQYFGGMPVALTVDVTPASVTGTVTILDGSTVLAQLSLKSGAASFTTSALATGIHSLSASFGGNANQDASQSPALAIEVDPSPTTVAIAPIPSSLIYGMPLVLTATISPTTATGSILFKESVSGQTLGQSPFVNGYATLTIGAPVIGSHAFTAVYSGDSLDLPAVSSAVITQVMPVPTSVTLAPLPANVTWGTSVTLAASVNPSAASGMITFTDSTSGTMAKVAIVNGVASFATSALSVGSHLFAVSYSGDSLRGASTSTTISTTIHPLTSTTLLASLPPTIYAGNPVTLSATISPASASGNVVFRDANVGVLGEAAIAHGVASLTMNTPAVASYAITAAYSGDTDYTASTSNTVATQVTLNPTTLAFTAANNPAPVAAPLVLSASTSPSATGMIGFFDGTALLGTASLSNGKVSFSTSTLATGAHSLHAAYAGDALYASATSTSVAETIVASSTSTSLAVGQGSVVWGSPILFNVRVTSSQTVPTGSITIRSGAMVLATASLANAATGAAYATISASSTLLGLGTSTLVASYSGDLDDSPSDSGASGVSINIVAMPTTATLSLSSLQLPLQTAVTLTATISATGPMPSGAVAFFSNGKTIATAALNAASVATATVSSLGIGTYAITASYGASGNFAASTSAPESLNVTAPLTLALAPKTVSLSPGQSAASTLTLTPLSGFTGATATTCQTTASWVTCGIGAVPAFAGAAPVSAAVRLSVSTTTAAAEMHTPPNARALPIAFALCLPLLAFGRRRMRPLALLLCAIAMAGCAEGGDFGSIPPGAQTVTISTVAAGVTITTSMTVNVSQ